MCSTGWVVPILLWDSEGWLCRSIRINKVSGEGSGSCRCGVYQIVFDHCSPYFIFKPTPVYSLVCELVIGDEYYALFNAILLDISVYEKYCWEHGVVGSREDCAVEYLSSRHPCTEVLQCHYDSI